MTYRVAGTKLKLRKKHKYMNRRQSVRRKGAEKAGIAEGPEGIVRKEKTKYEKEKRNKKDSKWDEMKEIDDFIYKNTNERRWWRRELREEKEIREEKKSVGINLH